VLDAPFAPLCAPALARTPGAPPDHAMTRGRACSSRSMRLHLHPCTLHVAPLRNREPPGDAVSPDEIDEIDETPQLEPPHALQNRQDPDSAAAAAGHPCSVVACCLEEALHTGQRPKLRSHYKRRPNHVAGR
jgi:hypothetical protein